MKDSAARKLELEAVEEQKTPITPARVIPLRPSAWEGVKAWVKTTLTEERIAEAVLVTAALSLWGLLSFGFYQALQNYTILP